MDRCIREVEEDPKRSVRKLVDLGRQLARGRFQRQYLDLTQKMLENEESPYYTQIRNVVKKADHETVKTFGINVGLGSWTHGAETIRTLEAARECRIPWGLTLHLAGGDGAPAMDLYRRVVAEGKADGIFTYFLRADGPACDLSPVLELVRREPGCAFLLFLPPEAWAPERVAALAACHNLVVSVDTGLPGWVEAASRLEAARCLYGVHCTYGNRRQAEEILSGAWMDRVTEAGCPAFAFCFAGPGCPEPVCRRVGAFVRRMRLEPRRAVFLMDFFSDYLYVDEIISGGHCFWGIRPDGALTRCRDGREIDAGEYLGPRRLSELWTEKDGT